MSELAAYQSRSCRVLGAAAVAYLILFSGVVGLWLEGYAGSVATADGLVLALPALLGLVLAMTSTGDPRQYVARVLAAMMFAPILLLFWATSFAPALHSSAQPVWPFALAAAVGHAGAFVATILLGGVLLTRVPALRGSSVLAAADLRARLLALDGLTPATTAVGDDADGVLVAWHAASGEERRHEIRLSIDAARRRVRVRERLVAAGAAPATAADASLRAPGEDRFDPARPRAQAVSGVTWQTTLIDPARLGELLPVVDARVLPPAAAGDGEALVTLLCALVTRSGWDWRPEFLARQRRP
jgi:hypothetical protein